MELTNPAVVRGLLAKYGLAPKKGYGQNFLVTPSVPRRIAALSRSLAPQDRPAGVLEIGPGVGALTVCLAEVYNRVEAVEIDRGLLPLLGETLADSPNAAVTEADFMKLALGPFLEEKFGDLLRDGGTVGVCANLPYYITTPVIMKLLESAPWDEPMPFCSLTVMVQLEVARRLAAEAGSADYGAITASVGLRCTAEKLMDVGPGHFLPPPKVSSAVIGLIPHGGVRELYPSAPADGEAYRAFCGRVSELISLGFGQRRKTLVNTLSAKYPKEKTAAALEACGLRPDIRAEWLSPAQFCRLADLLGEN